MKPKKLTLLSLTLLVTLLVGAVAVNVFSAPKRARAKGFFYPRTWVQGTPIPDPWNVELKFAPPRSVDEIDTSSILLEGLFSPSAEPYDGVKHKSRIVVPFKGAEVYAAAKQKIGHLTPGSHLVFLEITGELKDGTPFSTGMSSVIVLFLDNPPPP